MENTGVDCIKTSMKPYVDEYQSVVQGMELRQGSLKDEFSSIIEGHFQRAGWCVDIDKLSSKSHIDELTKLTNLLKGTRTNLEAVGTILRKIETRIETIEKVVGIDDYDLYLLSLNKHSRTLLNPP